MIHRRRTNFPHSATFRFDSKSDNTWNCTNSNYQDKDYLYWNWGRNVSFVNEESSRHNSLVMCCGDCAGSISFKTCILHDFLSLSQCSYLDITIANHCWIKLSRQGSESHPYRNLRGVLAIWGIIWTVLSPNYDLTIAKSYVVILVYHHVCIHHQFMYDITSMQCHLHQNLSLGLSKFHCLCSDDLPCLRVCHVVSVVYSYACGSQQVENSLLVGNLGCIGGGKDALAKNTNIVYYGGSTPWLQADGWWLQSKQDHAEVVSTTFKAVRRVFVEIAFNLVGQFNI